MKSELKAFERPLTSLERSRSASLPFCLFVFCVFQGQMQCFCQIRCGADWRQSQSVATAIFSSSSRLGTQRAAGAAGLQAGRPFCRATGRITLLPGFRQEDHHSRCCNRNAVHRTRWWCRPVSRTSRQGNAAKPTRAPSFVAA